MSRKPLSMFTAILVALALSIPTSVSSQAIVIIAFSFAGINPGEEGMFVFTKTMDRSAPEILGSSVPDDRAIYTIVVTNTSSPDSMDACEATVETELVFTGSLVNYFRLAVIDDGSQVSCT